MFPASVTLALDSGTVLALAQLGGPPLLIVGAVLVIQRTVINRLDDRKARTRAVLASTALQGLALLGAFGAWALTTFHGGCQC